MKDIYTIIEIKAVDDVQLKARVSLDANHQVFDGHFPEKPVLPGVIELEIIKSILSQHFQKKFRLLDIKNAKYLGMILPEETPEFEVEISYQKNDNILKVKALILHQTNKFLKFSGNFSCND